MIRFFDATTLAFTKLRTRRIRTATTIIIASLLFATIALALLVLQGSIDSAKKFSTGSLSDRYLTNATFSPKTSFISFSDGALPTSVKTRAVEIYNQTIADKKAAAKKLGIEYDPTTEQKPLATFTGLGEILDSSSPSAIQAFNEFLDTQPRSAETLQKIIAKYHPVHMYPVLASNINGQMKSLKNGVEDFVKPPAYPSGPGTVDLNFGWSYIGEEVTKPFMLSKTQLDSQKNTKDIPLIAPIGKVEQALGLKPLPNKATANERLERIRYIRDHAESATFSLCYRNTVSQSQIEAAVSTAKEIETNKTNKDYRKPSLIYGLPPADACAAAVVTSDTRTAAEKTLAGKQQEFQRIFEQETEPIQQKVTFRVVGLSPNGIGADAFSGIGGLFTAIVGSTLQGQWVVPQQMYDAMPNKQDFARFLPTAPKSPTEPHYDTARIIAEFANAKDAKAFVTRVGCGSEYCDKESSAIYFGSNSVLIDELRTQVIKILLYIAGGIGVIAAIIMMGMIGRVISDSRRETAVFRAIGAKRNDIRLIYLSYTFMLAVITIITSLLLGGIAAWWVNSKLSPDLTVQAHLAYIFANDNLSFSLIGFWREGLLVLVALILLTAFIGMLLPLSRNLARNPIKDMRDDT